VTCKYTRSFCSCLYRQFRDCTSSISPMPWFTFILCSYVCSKILFPLMNKSIVPSHLLTLNEIYAFPSSSKLIRKVSKCYLRRNLLTVHTHMPAEISVHQYILSTSCGYQALYFQTLTQLQQSSKDTGGFYGKHVFYTFMPRLNHG
jgi:hypothetical protein